MSCMCRRDGGLSPIDVFIYIGCLGACTCHAPSDSQQLSSHAKTHSTEKNYSCSERGLKFKNNTSFWEHKRTKRALDLSTSNAHNAPQVSRLKRKKHAIKSWRTQIHRPIYALSAKMHSSIAAASLDMLDMIIRMSSMNVRNVRQPDPSGRAIN